LSLSLSCWNVKGEEEEEEVDQVVAVEVGLVLDANLAATEAQAAIEAVAAVEALGFLERRKPTLILSHHTLNNNMEDPIQVSRVKQTQILSHPTPNSNTGPILVSKANPDNSQVEAALEAVDLSTPVTELVTLLVKITLEAVDLSTQEAKPTLDLTSEVVDSIIGTIMVPQITATTTVVATMVVVIVTITTEATCIPAPTTTVLDPAMVVRIMDTLAVACSTINTGNLVACLAEAKDLSPLEPELDFWAGQWQVWQPCRCITDTECTPV